MTTFVTIIFVAVSLMLILGILLQSGRGGGLGIGSGSSGAQVLGAGGGADLMSRLTQSFAALFVICAIYLAYVSSHSGSSNLRAASEEVQVDNDVPLEEVDWEMVAWGRAALPLPEEGE